MKYILKIKLYVLLLFLNSCLTYGIQSSFNIEDSKKMGVFVAEYTPKYSIVKISDYIVLDIKEIWLEYDWGYSMDGKTEFYKNDKRRFLYVLFNGQIMPLKGLGMSADIKEYDESFVFECSDDRGRIMFNKIENPPKKIRITILKSAKIRDELGYFYIYLKE